MDATRRMTVGELAREAGVTPRTVRYYVAEGLLPPPAYEGRQSWYGPRHLLIVRAIRAMQAEDLPLRKIALALSSSTDEALEEIARRPGPEGPARGDAAAPMDRVGEPARSYDEPRAPGLRRPPEPRALLEQLLQRPARRLVGEAMRADAARERGAPEEPVWRRVEVGEGVEIHFTAGGSREREALIRAAAEALRVRLRRLEPPEEPG